MSFGISLSHSFCFPQSLLQTIPDLFALWTAEKATVSAGLIDSLPDQSTNNASARDLVKVGATGPTFTAQDPDFNNFPSVSSAIANRRLQSTFDVGLPQPNTVYLVHKISTNPGTVFWRTNGGNFDNSQGMTISSAGNLTMQTLNAGPAITSPSSVIDDACHVTCCIYDGNNSSAVYIDDHASPIASSPGDGSVAVNDANVMTIGSFGTAVDYSWALMACFAGTHNQATRNQIMTWLGRKYKIPTT